MFSLARRFIKTALVFLLVGLGVGLYMYVGLFALGRWPSRILVTAHVHILLVGFLLSMIFGVALWMFPRKPDMSHLTSPLGEATYWFLTLGTALRFAAEVVVSAVPTASYLKAGAIAGATAQLVAVGLFVAAIWGRIRPVGRLK